MDAESWKLVAAIGGTILATVTGPLALALRSEGRRIQAELTIVKASCLQAIAETEVRLMQMIAENSKAIIETEARIMQRIASTELRLAHDIGEVNRRLDRLEDRAGIIHKP